MARKKPASVRQEEIAHLAYVYWQNEGGVHGRDHQHWREAELHLKATKHLHLEETVKRAGDQKRDGKTQAKAGESVKSRKS
ncbi:MAG TPA: DUF2934 domain-containing protein [Candidatus Acidoferrales bacterium]|jgi:hypothetical protein|nr:DUF2934 domain-containing protein [Candidatus Acidoferrales bacterium]